MELNGSVEVLYADNAFTPVGPRQTRHYRVHTLYRPKPWATLSGAYNDLERHNNTNNNQRATAQHVPVRGPLDHVDHSRVVSLGAVLTPNEHYGLDFNYAYSDVYAATNICYDNGARRLDRRAAARHCLDQQQRRPERMPWRVHQGVDDPAWRIGLPGTSWMLRRNMDRWLSCCPRSTNSTPISAIASAR